jgi:hypothetical protein
MQQNCAYSDELDEQQQTGLAPMKLLRHQRREHHNNCTSGNILHIGFTEQAGPASSSRFDNEARAAVAGAIIASKFYGRSNSKTT